MPVYKGMEAAKKAASKASTSNFIQNLTLREDGDSARIRFLTSADEIVSGLFHRNKVPQGYIENVLCTENEECGYCVEGDKPSFKFIAWVWVHEVLHAKQTNTEWKTTKRGTRTYFREKVDSPQILRQGFYLYRDFETWYSRYGSLTDRDYEIERQGAAGSTKTRYKPIPLDPEPLGFKVKGLPELEDIAEGSADEMPEIRIIDSKTAPKTKTKDTDDSDSEEESKSSVRRVPKPLRKKEQEDEEPEEEEEEEKPAPKATRSKDDDDDDDDKPKAKKSRKSKSEDDEDIPW